MYKTEAKQLLSKYLLPAIEKYGYDEKAVNSLDFEFRKRTRMGQDVILGGFTDYNPVQKIVYSVSKRHKAIIEILQNLQKSGIKFSPQITSSTDLIGISYERMNKLDYFGYLPEMETEHDVQKCVSLMLDFLESTAFPLADKFEDLREIDVIINGKNPWETDWETPYAFGGNFFEKRVIIAKLAGNPNFDFIVDFNYKTMEKLSAESGSPFVYDRNDLTKPLPALIRMLQGIKPLY